MGRVRIKDIVCSKVRCNKPIFMKGLCGPHYRLDLQERRGKKEECSLSKCRSPQYYNGICRSHYEQEVKIRKDITLNTDELLDIVKNSIEEDEDDSKKKAK